MVERYVGSFQQMAGERHVLGRRYLKAVDPFSGEVDNAKLMDAAMLILPEGELSDEPLQKMNNLVVASHIDGDGLEHNSRFEEPKLNFEE